MSSIAYDSPHVSVSQREFETRRSRNKRSCTGTVLKNTAKSTEKVQIWCVLTFGRARLVFNARKKVIAVYIVLYTTACTRTVGTQTKIIVGEFSFGTTYL